MANITVMCEVNATSFNWKVNGTFFININNDDLHSDDVQLIASTYFCTLYILAKAEYNGTEVQCVASVPGGDFMESPNATVLIQGIIMCILQCVLIDNVRKNYLLTQV